MVVPDQKGWEYYSQGDQLGRVMDRMRSAWPWMICSVDGFTVINYL